MSDLVAELAEAPLVAMITEPANPGVAGVVAALGTHGIRAVEITLTTPDAVETVRRSVQGADCLVGAGTVLTPELARQAVDAGADYLLTPGVLPEVLAEAKRLGVPVVCGAFTLTEVVEAWQRGAALVKVFPAWLGGPKYISAIHAALPQIPLVPTGGVTIDTIPAHLRAGATAVALGRPVIGDALHGGHPDDLKGRVDDAFAAVRRAKAD